jgi:DNA modification methylase
MIVTQLKVSDLKSYEKNTKKHPKEQVAKIAASISEFGFNVPVIVDKHNVLIAGHGRIDAARKLGLETVPAIVKDDLTAEQIKAFRIADNKVAESPWDFDYLREEFEFLEQANYDLSLTGFDAKEIQEFMPDDDLMEPEAQAVDDVQTEIQEGDVFFIGSHKLMCGDSTNYAIIKQFCGEFTPDLCYTDPPYGMNAVSKSGVLSKNYSGDIKGDDDNSVAIKSFKAALSLFPSMKNCWWGANYYSEVLPSSECWFVWDKNNGGSDQADCELAFCDFRSVARIYKQASEKINRVHPTQKPVSLFQAVVGRFDKKHIIINILDLFGGSGSTMVACEQLNRKCYMMELDPKYCQVIINRMRKLTPDIEIKCENREVVV